MLELSKERLILDLKILASMVNDLIRSLSLVLLVAVEVDLTVKIILQNTNASYLWIV